MAGICKAFGVEGYDAPELSTIMARRENIDAFVALLEKVYAAAEQTPVADGMRRMEEEKAPCGVALPPARLHEDPHVQAIGMLEESHHPVAGRLRQPRPPARFERTPARLGGPAPMIGQHTDEILGELGLEDEVARLREAGIVA